MPVFPGRIDQKYDVQGSLTVNESKTLAEENASEGVEATSSTGDSITMSGSDATLACAAATFTNDHIGMYVTVSGASNGGNNGTFLIKSRPSSTSVIYTNALGVTETSSFSWKINAPYSLEDDLNFVRTDRKLIKGTTHYYDAVPTYQRPSAVGTSVPANLSNIAGKTLDALSVVIDVLQPGIKLRPGIADTDGSVSASDETFATTNYHFTADDLGSFISLVDVGAEGATGTYRIKTVTDGKTLELEGLSATTGGTVSWTLEADLKAIASSRSYADSVDRRGIPISDSGAYDATNYDATYVEMINPVTNGRPVEEDGDPIWARSYGDEKDSGTGNEGTRFFVQLMTGSNGAGATDSLLESVSGRSGSAASVTNGALTITGLVGTQQSTGTGDSVTVADAAGKQTLTDAGATFSSADVDRVITISGMSNGVNNGTFLITDYVSATSIKYINSSGLAETASFTWTINTRAVTAADIGKYISIFDTAVDGNQRHSLITAFAEGQFTVSGSNFATDANSGSIKWKISRHPGTWNFYNGDRYRRDEVPETAGRRILIGGIAGDAELTQDIGEIRNFIGAADGDTNPSLSNTGNYYPFSNIPNPSASDVEEALNILNQQIGDRNYAGTILTDGQTITASLLALESAIEGSSITRTIERLSAAVPKLTAHSLPSVTYTLDGTGNGRNMYVFWRKQLRDPGTVANGDDYEETSTASITPYETIRDGDHINYFILR